MWKLINTSGYFFFVEDSIKYTSPKTFPLKTAVKSQSVFQSVSVSCSAMPGPNVFKPAEKNLRLWLKLSLSSVS